MTGLAKLAIIGLLTGAPASAAPPQNSCPDSHPWTGHVETWTFGFAFDVPTPLKAYWNSPGCVQNKDECTCMGDFGRIIPLGSENEDHQIELYAAHYDPDLSEPSPGQNKYSIYAGDAEPGTIHLVKRKSTRLGGLPAHMFIVTYRDAKSHIDMVQETWVAVRGGRIQYTPYLRSPRDSYRTDRLTFLRILSSLRLTKGEYTG